MIRTLKMNKQDARLYMAGTSLTRFIGFESLEDYCSNTVIAVGDIDTDDMVFFSNSIDRDVYHLEETSIQRFSEYFESSVAAYVVAEYRPQADLFFSLNHLRHCYEQGIYNDSLSYPCLVLDDTVHIRASFELEKDETTGHVFATVVLIDVTRFYSERQALATASTRDTLTGAINRVTAADTVREYIINHLDGPAGLAVVNIDNFRMVNERFGHEYGDRVLMKFVDEMQSYFGRDILVSRTSGDEFALFFPDMRKQNVDELVSRFANQEHDGFEYNDNVHKFRITAGVAMYPEHGYTYDELMSLANEAMHTAKLDVDTHYLMFDEQTLGEYREQRGLSLNELLGNVPAAILVYKAYGNEEILFANRELISLFECDDIDDFMAHTGGRFAGVPHPDDVPRVNREIWSQIRGVSHDNTDYCRFRIVTKNGTVKHVEDFGRIVESEAYGKAFFVALHDEHARI